MKKTPALLLIILFLLIGFSSCNLDVNTGIFRKISQAKAPLTIRYEKLLGYTTDPATSPGYFYYWTTTGIHRFNETLVKETLVKSFDENLIQDAAFWNASKPLADQKVFYLTNNQAEIDAKTINVINTSSLTSSTVLPSSTFITPLADLAINGLYPNGMLLINDKNVAGLFELLKYDNVDTEFKIPVAQFPLPTTGYGLEAVIQQTAKEHDDSKSLIVSFVKNLSGGGAEYKHYVVDPSLPLSVPPVELDGFDSLKIANFMVDSDSSKRLYVLTTDGTLYYAGPTAAPVTKELMKESGKTFTANAFALAVDDDTNTNFHLITKPSTKDSSLYVFTFPHNSTDKTDFTISTVNSGYAKELALANIVSAQVKSAPLGGPTKLLVATVEDGMFDINIIHANANVNGSSNGDSSGAEKYTFL